MAGGENGLPKGCGKCFRQVEPVWDVSITKNVEIFLSLVTQNRTPRKTAYPVWLVDGIVRELRRHGTLSATAL
jgi:hypothetical protein